MRGPCPECQTIAKHRTIEVDGKRQMLKRFIPQSETIDPLIYCRAEIIMMECPNRKCGTLDFFCELSIPLAKPEVQGNFIKVPEKDKRIHQDGDRWYGAIENNPAKGSTYEPHLSEFTKKISWCRPGQYILGRYFSHRSQPRKRPFVGSIPGLQA